ncbi:hypothetical protein EPO15_10685 [bacterium]|nr:MAG: hypothetical protein EPO15_10685 [bacterium]
MGQAALWTAGGFAATTALFGWRQNRGGVVGGPISLPKVLWLNLTLTVFFGLPAVLWRDGALSPGMRALWGWLLLSFVLRAVIELYLIYVTITWKCVYGISHDFFTLALAGLLRAAMPAPAPGDARAAAFLWLYTAVLVVEAGMAKAFSLLADPKTGIYFASDDERFKRVNRASWAASLAGYGALAGLLFS